ncbi:hypothetical protein [Sphingomonas abietis]|uniref:Uncharacterized protein n=1 Tax=Sphingomonas abietis TaxID=3012344 RepID=A0ABY7NR33_9SPHN|nr:hypothetical protein [Sphingomonas abietis]WBO23978.1 hypothetical protein PBT88_07665 [Sphingomonas abietis]
MRCVDCPHDRHPQGLLPRRARCCAEEGAIEVHYRRLVEPADVAHLPRQQRRRMLRKGRP